MTNLPGADLNSSAGPKGGGQDARNKVRQGTPYRRLATNGGEKCGLDLIETMTMTVLVIAGAAQFTALALLEEQAPTLIVIIAALAVNLRMAMYSAALLAFAVGIGLKSVLGAVFTGMFGLYLMQYLFA